MFLPLVDAMLVGGEHAGHVVVDVDAVDVMGGHIYTVQVELDGEMLGRPSVACATFVPESSVAEKIMVSREQMIQL